MSSQSEFSFDIDRNGVLIEWTERWEETDQMSDYPMTRNERKSIILPHRSGIDLRSVLNTKLDSVLATLSREANDAKRKHIADLEKQLEALKRSL